MLKISFEATFLLLASLYIAITVMLLVMTISRVVFNYNDNYLTTFWKDIKLSLFWPIAIFSEEGLIWLKVLLNQ